MKEQIKASYEFRPVVDGESLTGRGSYEAGFPEIQVYDGVHVMGNGESVSAFDGSLLFTITAFKTASVRMNEDGTTLVQIGNTDIVSEGLVTYGIQDPKMVKEVSAKLDSIFRPSAPPANNTSGIATP